MFLILPARGLPRCGVLLCLGLVVAFGFTPAAEAASVDLTDFGIGDSETFKGAIFRIDTPDQVAGTGNLSV